MNEVEGRKACAGSVQFFISAPLDVTNRTGNHLMKLNFFFLFISVLLIGKTKAEKITTDSVCNVIVMEDSTRFFLELKTDEKISPNTFLLRIKEKIEIHKKLISAVLAFPLPLGVVGAHRIYLGSKPYIPIVYIATVGGCFGILPLIDFVVILFTKKEALEKFENNNKVFMWAN